AQRDLAAVAPGGQVEVRYVPAVGVLQGEVPRVPRPGPRAPHGALLSVAPPSGPASTALPPAGRGAGGTRPARSGCAGRPGPRAGRRQSPWGRSAGGRASARPRPYW